MIYYPLVLAMLVFNCFADAPPRYSEYPSVEVSGEVWLSLCLALFLIVYVYRMWDDHSQNMRPNNDGIINACILISIRQGILICAYIFLNAYRDHAPSRVPHFCPKSSSHGLIHFHGEDFVNLLRQKTFGIWILKTPQKKLFLYLINTGKKRFVRHRSKWA